MRNMNRLGKWVQKLFCVMHLWPLFALVCILSAYLHFALHFGHFFRKLSKRLSKDFQGWYLIDFSS